MRRRHRGRPKVYQRSRDPRAGVWRGDRGPLLLGMTGARRSHENVLRGKWADHRFDITKMARHEMTRVGRSLKAKERGRT